MFDRLRKPHPRLLPTPLSDPPIVHEERKLLVRSAEGTLVQVTEHEMGKLLESSRLPQGNPPHVAPPVDPDLHSAAEALVKDATELKRILAARNGHQVRGEEGEGGGRRGDSSYFLQQQEEIITARSSRHAVVPTDKDTALSRAVEHLAQVAEHTHAHLSSIRAKEAESLAQAQLQGVGATVTAVDSNAVFVSVKAANKRLLGSTAVYGVRRGEWREGGRQARKAREMRRRKRLIACLTRSSTILLPVTEPDQGSGCDNTSSPPADGHIRSQC